MEIRTFTPYLTLIGLMVVASLALAFTVDVRLNDQAGVRMQLPDELPGGWHGDQLRYSHNPDRPMQYRVSELEFPNIDPETGERLFTMSLAEYDALPKDTEFIKSVYTNEVGHEVFVSIVLSGMERDSIHRPQRCLVGQGSSITATRYVDVPMEGRDPLRVAILEHTQHYRGPEGERKTYHGYYAYWFVGQNRETHSHYMRMFWLAWDRIFNSIAHRWAYIAVAGDREEGSDAYQEEIIDFVQRLHPQLLLVDEPEPAGAEVEERVLTG